jgi:transcriptional regulator with XRE-family HTH domain
MTLEDFASRVDCHLSTASRLRSGERLPSLTLLARIGREFELPLPELVAQYERGRPAFAEYLRTNVFDSPA